MQTDLIGEFRRKIEEGAVLGPFSKTSDPAFIEIMGHAGFDFVIIDLEHGPNTILNAQNLIRAAECAGLFPIIRAKEDKMSTISEALDIGAGGVLIPKITSAADALKAMEIAKFAPMGMRGMCRYVRAAKYTGIPGNRYFKDANESVVIFGVEGTEAIGALDEILEVEGIDIVFIGPFDLSQSVGVPGEIDHPKVTKAMESVVEKCLRKNVHVGTFCETPEAARMWRDTGIKFISYSVDVGLFYGACSDLIKKLSMGAGRL